MAFDELIAWSNHEARPEWQRDALRRIATTGELSVADLSALRQMIEKNVALIDGEVPAADPLTTDHLSDAATEAPRTIIGSIGPVRHVDRLASDQPPIKFAKYGITLVYGANGSGKSGYCRIAKQLCRSLSPENLKGDVFAASPVDPPEIDLVFGVAGGEPERQETEWRHGEPSPPELARISVFDAATARVYVDKDRKVEFLPYELDLLNKLALAARDLDAGFAQSETALDSAIRIPLPAGYSEGTAVGQALAKLTPDTAAEDLPQESALRALAEWSDDKEVELQQVIDEARKVPAAQIRAHRSAKQELEGLKNQLNRQLSLLSDEGVGKLVEAQVDMIAKNEAAQSAARGIGGDHPIPDIGTKAWRQMLVYAREYAGEVFPDRSDPKLVTSETCVLCQQPLGADAAARMADFDRYISGRAESESAEATEAYEGLVRSINEVRIATPEQTTELLAAFAGMSDERQALSDKIATTFAAFRKRLDVISAIIADHSYDGLEGLDPLQADLIDQIDAEIASLQSQIEVLERLEADPERIQQVVAAKADLEDRKRLGQEIEIVVERLNRLVERLKIQKARKQCGSRAIAIQLTARRRALLTDSLKAHLAEELRALRISHIPIDLSDRSEGGDSVIEIGLTAKQRIANNSDVLSEGEQRALALSCFLAELREVGTGHGIIVDDPVSSLDHSRMEAVAKRLTAEALAGRQVIIFTHNIVFHSMIENEARLLGVPCHAEWMFGLGGAKAGIIDDSGKPPHIKKTKQRIGELGEAKSQLFKEGYDPAAPIFRDPLTAIYSRMRETWERMIEEILFNGTIQRFRPEVMTQSLKHASFDPADDYPEIFEGMKRCSHYSGHDLAADLPPELPSKETIEADLKALTDFYQKVSERKSALEKGHSYEKGPTAEFL
jgi:energy-coupling factor transporter ATP-binding protein EcfA2